MIVCCHEDLGHGNESVVISDLQAYKNAIHRGMSRVDDPDCIHRHWNCVGDCTDCKRADCWASSTFVTGDSAISGCSNASGCRAWDYQTIGFELYYPGANEKAFSDAVLHATSLRRAGVEGKATGPPDGTESTKACTRGRRCSCSGTIYPHVRHQTR